MPGGMTAKTFLQTWPEEIESFSEVGQLRPLQFVRSDFAGLHHERRTTTARQPAGSSYQQSVAAAPHLSIALEFLELYGDKKWTSMPTTHQHRS
jgi:hypothetical protein